MQYSKTSATIWKIVSTGLKTEKPVTLTEKQVIKLIRSEIISGGAQVYNHNTTRGQWMRLSETYLNNYVIEVQKINELQEIERRETEERKKRERQEQISQKREARVQKAELRRKNTSERRKVIIGTLGKLAGRISPVDLLKLAWSGVVGLFSLFCLLCFVGLIYGIVMFIMDFSATNAERKVLDGVSPIEELESILVDLKAELDSDPDKYCTAEFTYTPPDENGNIPRVVFHAKNIKVDRNIIKTQSAVFPYKATVEISYENSSTPAAGKSRLSHLYEFEWERNLRSNRGQWREPRRTAGDATHYYNLNQLIKKMILMQGPTHID
jgi:hypothetical protein